MTDLSVIIPSYRDVMLFKTIRSILDHFDTDFEIIPVLDGYTPDQAFDDDPRIRPLALTLNGGMREAINAGVAASTGRYIMRTDEHCMFADGFDRVMLETIAPHWIVTARRYFLDPVRWEIMDREPVDCEKLVIVDKPHKGIRKFSGLKWTSRERELLNEPIIESMMMQGSCWIMRRAWWDKVIGRLETKGYGPLYQDTTEMVFKTWQAGGRLMVNKQTWFAHKHRDFNRSHQYPVERAIPEWQYALDVWGDYYESKVRPKWNL